MTPPVLSIVIPVYNEEAVLPFALTKFMQLMNGLIDKGLVSSNSCCLFVDDGSVDNSWALLEEAHGSDCKICALKLSRNFGHNSALLAGLMTIKERCDIAISIDCDLQQDPNVIPEFIEKYHAGNEVVLGIRNDRQTDGVFKKYTALGFYGLMKRMGVKLYANHADYRLLGCRALAALSEYREPNLFLRAICVDLGFPCDVVYFNVMDRTHGTSKYSFSKMLNFAVTGITSFTAFPLRIISILGVVVFGASLLMSAYILIKAIIIGGTVPGWASTILPIYFLGGLQILCMGIVGEYLAQVYASTKGRPRYIIEKEMF